MRASVSIFAFIFAPAVLAQTPAQPAVPKYLSEQQVAEMRKNGLLPPEDNDPSDDAPPATECIKALQSIDNERAASDAALNRGKAEPTELKQVYEQDMYYANKRLKVIDRLCLVDGKSRSHDFGRWKTVQALSSSRQGCAIVAKNCKPLKHW